MSNRSLSSGERDFCFFLCASASVCKILIFFQEEGTHAVSHVLQHYCIKFEFFSLVREIVDSFFVQRHLVLKPVLSFWKRETPDIISLLWNLFLHFVQKTFSMLFDLSWCLSA